MKMTIPSTIRRTWSWLRRNVDTARVRALIKIKHLCIDFSISDAMRSRYVERLNASGILRETWAPIISLTVPVRHLGVKRNYFERYLQELITKTVDPSRLELLVKVDLDDDLRWYCKIFDKYGAKLCLRFFVSAQEQGYASTNWFHHFLIHNRHPASQIWVLQSADTEILVDSWDDILLNTIASHRTPYFICTDATLEESISIKGPNPVSPQPVYWVRGTLFPIASTALLDVLEEESREHKGWAMVGKTFNIDGFFGDMLRHLYEIHDIDAHIQIPMLFKEYKPEGWHGNPRREGLRTKSLLDFFSEETQGIHKKFAAKIARRISDGSEFHKSV